MGTLSGESNSFFIFVSHLSRGQLLKKRVCSRRSKFFPLRVDDIMKGLHWSGKQTGRYRSYFPCKHDKNRGGELLHLKRHVYRPNTFDLELHQNEV